MSSQSIALIIAICSGIVFSGFSIGQSIAKQSLPKSPQQITEEKTAPDETKKETLLSKVFGKKEEEPTNAPTTFPSSKKESPSNNKKTTPTTSQGTTSPTSGTVPTSVVSVVTNPTTVPTSYPTSATTVYATPVPTTSQTSPTTAPTSVPSATATIQVDAVWHSGTSDQSVYRGIVKIKDANSGTTLAQGTTSSSGRITFSNVPANRKVDAILLQPTDWQTEYCGDKQTFDLAAGQFKGLLMRIRSQGSSPCEK